MKKNLADLTTGSRGRVAGYVSGFKEYKQRLMSMGLVPNTTFTVTRVAPMGDPVEICIRDYNLSLRKDEARTVLVEGL
ncbi:MAG TPA: ferrous iron transport protein A [Thermodesulfobacteriaceae bacterium]|nr:ferrous iron transport protein A [Thermodesulfobacteriaceae bacterium]